VIEFVPKTMAPNLLTLCAFLSMVCAYLLVSLHCPSMSECNLPGWGYIALALCIFSYQTLDNLDGRQARRTGSSSALGEVFDHGADTLTVPLFAISIGSALQLGETLTFYCFIASMVTFYLYTWEGYFTGGMILRSLENPEEAQTILEFFLILTFFFGPSMWISEWNIFGYFLQLNQLFVFFMLTGMCVTVYKNIANVRRHLITRNLATRPALLCLIPFGLLIGMTLFWNWLSPTLLRQHPRLFIMTIGFLFSYLTIRLIVHAVCHEMLKLYYNVLTPLFIINIFSFIGSLLPRPIIEDEVILSLYFLATFLHIVYLILSIVGEFCHYLNIRPFTITKPPLEV